MAGVLSNLWGTTKTIFRLGKGGPQLKANAGTIESRNAADTDYAGLRALLVEVFGDDIELNAGAAGSGDDWRLTLSRAATGQTEHLQVVWPGPSPATGQSLAVASIAAGVVTLEWVNSASGNDKAVVDNTNLAFGDSGPVALFSLGAGGVVTDIEVIIDTPWDGTPSASIGVTGNASKFMASSEIDLTSAAGTIWHVKPGVAPEVGVQALEMAYSQGSATQGAARVLVHYVPDPS
jgi:hypothetical protein